MLEQIQNWSAIAADIATTLAALVASVVALIGLAAWKRELAGKELYSATKNLVWWSHKLKNSLYLTRAPVETYERRVFSPEQHEITTEGERWRITEAEVYRSRAEKLFEINRNYRDALLTLRVLLGSKVYLWFQPFSECTTETLRILGEYLQMLDDHSQPLRSDYDEVKEIQSRLHPDHEFKDKLSVKIADTREEGEKKLLPYLSRKTIRG